MCLAAAHRPSPQRLGGNLEAELARDLHLGRAAQGEGGGDRGVDRRRVLVLHLAGAWWKA